MRAKVFVSYSHRDASWLKMCEQAFGTGVYAKAFEIWSDKKIETSANWKQTIEATIASSRIALLLVSKNFLKSDFIAAQELPTILKRHAKGGLKIWWIPLDDISDTELRLAELNEIHAACPPNKPLSKLNGKERANAIAKVFERIIEELGVLIDVPDDVRADLKHAVEEALGTDTIISEPIAPGDSSIIYKAKRRGNDVAVKALIPSARRQWLAEDFICRANVVRKIHNYTVIGIIDVIDNRRAQCIVTEFVGAPTLEARLTKEGCLPATLVARVLKHLARVAAQLHRMEDQPIIGPIRPSQVYYDEAEQKVRISLVHIANETFKSCRQRPTLLLDDDALTYLSPERYEGQNVDAAADQYYLGLLGLELLLGKPHVDVATFAKLETKKHFFDSPRSYFGKLPTEDPAFSFVLARMLERKPENRWPSMSGLIGILQQLEAEVVPDVVREHADHNYDSNLRNNANFFHSFYSRLFESSDEIAKLFEQRNVTMAEQYRKLDHAMVSILAFNPRLRATTLDPQIESHANFGLSAAHFGLFREAFLHALRETQGADEYSQEAWRAILNPALTYMRDKTLS